MKATAQRHNDGTVVLVVEFSPRDLSMVRLYDYDYSMLREPQKGVSDFLLDAELIARRIEETESEARS